MINEQKLIDKLQDKIDAEPNNELTVGILSAFMRMIEAEDQVQTVSLEQYVSGLESYNKVLVENKSLRDENAVLKRYIESFGKSFETIENCPQNTDNG